MKRGIQKPYKIMGTNGGVITQVSVHLQNCIVKSFSQALEKKRRTLTSFGQI